MKKCLDICCGRGGWTRGFLNRGFEVVGVDLHRHPDYPTGVLLCDILALDGALFRGFDVVVASPPCDVFARLDKGWIRDKGNIAWAVTLFRRCEEIAREAGAPLILENVRGAQKVVGRAVAHFDSYYLWGDGVPALLPSHTHARWKECRSSSRPDLRAEIPLCLADYVAGCYA